MNDNFSGFEADQAFNRGGPPTFAVLGTWNTAIPWVGGAYHGWTNIDHIDLAMELFADDGIFVVTEAFSMLHGWAEGPIKVADRVLEKYLGVERPWSFPVEDIEQYTHDTSSAPKTTGSTGEGCERQLPPVSLEEIQEHDMPDDCYVAMHGVVYDLTTFATTHAGGSESIYSTCGTEGTADFAAFHGPSLLNAVSSNIVGPYGASSLAAHDSEDDCWAIIHGKIYDLTLFEHTGPMGPVHDICGQDGTAAFDSRHGGRPELLNNITHLVIVPTLPSSIVQDHDSVDDCWSIIDGTIYDLTLFNHTGPMGPIRDICGKDGTADFNAKHGARPELLDSLSGFIVAQAHVVLEITVGGASSGNSGGGSGGSSGGGSGSGGGAGDEVFCFTADALVLMADGTLQSIQDVQVGDFVDTGTGQGRGRVTQTLHHPIYNHVPVTRLETAHGVLVGTPSHPVLSFAQQEEDGGVLSSWVAFQSLATDNGTVDNNNNKMEYIDVFYNLEIDGEDPYHIEGESSHSYVVNGIVASGLGDSAVLNRLYPRQQGWKDKKMRLTMDGLEEKDQ